MTKLKDRLPLNSNIIDKTYYNDWINVQDLLPDMLSGNVSEIPPAKVAKYRFDLHGLFKYPLTRI